MPLRNGWREGDWLYNCQRCGFTIYGSEAKREHTNLRVCSKCWDEKHPQEFVRGVRDDQTVPFANSPGEPYFLQPNEANPEGDNFIVVLAEGGDEVHSADGSTVLASS